MKMTACIPILMLLAGVGCADGAKAQESHARSQEEVERIVNPPLMKPGEQPLRFEHTMQNIGTLTEDDAPQTYFFGCTNTGKAIVSIARISTTCGCAAAELRREGSAQPVTLPHNVLPGETCTVVLTYHPKNHPGTVDANAFIYLSSSVKTPAARLTLTGNVLPSADEWARYPYAMGTLRLKQNQLHFRELTAGMQPSERILCGNSGNRPLRLSALLLPEFATFRTEPEVIAPGNEADIVLTIDASAIPAEKGTEFTFPVILEGVGGRPSDRTLTVKVNRIK